MQKYQISDFADRVAVGSIFYDVLTDTYITIDSIDSNSRVAYCTQSYWDEDEGTFIETYRNLTFQNLCKSNRFKPYDIITPTR